MKAVKSKQGFSADMKVTEGEVPNVHGAVITTPLIYNKKLSKPGHVWYVYTISKKSNQINAKTGRVSRVKNRVQGGIQILKEFENEHGVHNIKNMILQNILNPKKF